MCGLSAVRRAAHLLPAPPFPLRYAGMRRYGPLTVNTSSVDSFLPSPVQIAPWASQSSAGSRPGAQRSETAELRAVVLGPLAGWSNAK